YDPAAAPGSKFDPAGNPHNAFLSTVTVSGVRFLTASILNGASGTNVQKQALAAADCPGDEVTNFPMAICTRVLSEIQPGDMCTDHPRLTSLIPDGGQAGCWTNLGTGGSANINTYKPLLPQVWLGG